MIVNPQVGQRVRSNQVIDIFPLGIWPQGTMGTIETVETVNNQTEVHIRLATHYDCLNEWNNCLVVHTHLEYGSDFSQFDLVTDTLADMAKAARPIDDDDWGTERQIEAENAFFDAFHDAMGETPDFDGWCLHATTDEMIDEALRLLATKGLV